MLASVTGVPPGELAGALAAGRDARLLEPAGLGEDRFRHEMVRDAVDDAIPEADREELHARAGGVLAELAARGRDVDDAEAAYHLVRAGPAAAGQATEYARRAGDRAMAALAFEDAAHWYQHVAGLLAGAGPATATRRPPRSAWARPGWRPWTRTAAGPGSGRQPNGLAAPGGRTCSPGRPWAWAAGLPDSRSSCSTASRSACSKEARFALTEEEGPQTEAHSARTEGHGALGALVTARLSIASSLVVPERSRLELAAGAVRRARDAGDDAALAACLAALCDAIAGPDHCAERRDRATEIIDIAGRLRDPVLGLLGRRLRLVALLEAGVIADWDADALAYQIAAEALRHPLYAWYVPLWRGMRALAAGRFGECRDALAEAGRHRRTGRQPQRRHARGDPAVVPARRAGRRCWPAHHAAPAGRRADGRVDAPGHPGPPPGAGRPGRGGQRPVRGGGPAAARASQGLGVAARRGPGRRYSGPDRTPPRRPLGLRRPHALRLGHGEKEARLFAHIIEAQRRRSTLPHRNAAHSLTWDKKAIDVAKALARLSELTIFELRGEWRRLHRMPPPMRFSRDLLTQGISYKLRRSGRMAASPRPPPGSWSELAPTRWAAARLNPRRRSR